MEPDNLARDLALGAAFLLIVGGAFLVGKNYYATPDVAADEEKSPPLEMDFADLEQEVHALPGCTALGTMYECRTPLSKLPFYVPAESIGFSAAPRWTRESVNIEQGDYSKLSVAYPPGWKQTIDEEAGHVYLDLLAKDVSGYEALLARVSVFLLLPYPEGTTSFAEAAKAYADDIDPQLYRMQYSAPSDDLVIPSYLIWGEAGTLQP